MLIWMLLACFSSDGVGGGCDSVSDAVQREECFFQEATQLGSQRAEIKHYISLLTDPSSQDLLRLRLAVHDPSRNQWLCEEVKTRSAQDRCRQVVGRPHLQQKKKADR
jgi:hypothetical protein